MVTLSCNKCKSCATSANIAINHKANTNFQNDLQQYIMPTSSSSGRFVYDEIGNLIYDMTNPKILNKINWNLYGKVASIEMNVTSTPATVSDKFLNFNYDPLGNRFSKINTTFPVSTAGAATKVNIGEYYIRDASGNVLAIYKHRQDFKYIDISATIFAAIKPKPYFGTVLKSLMDKYAEDLVPIAAKLIQGNYTAIENLIDKPNSYYVNNNQSYRQAVVNANIDFTEQLLASTNSNDLTLLNKNIFDSYHPQFFDNLNNMDNMEILEKYIDYLVDPNDAKEFNVILNLFEPQPEPINDFKEFKNKFIDYVILDRNNVTNAMDNLYNTNITFYKVIVMRLLQQHDYLYASNFSANFTNLNELIKSWIVTQDDPYVATYINANPVLFTVNNSLITDEDKLLTVLQKVGAAAYDALKVDNTIFEKNGDVLDNDNAAYNPMYLVNLVNAIDPFGADVLPMANVLKADKFCLAEHHMYGSSRLGIKNYWPNHYAFNWDESLGVIENSTALKEMELDSRVPWYSYKTQTLTANNKLNPYTNPNNIPTFTESIIGQKQYELTNHLGNEMTVILDKVVNKPSNVLATLPTTAVKRAALQSAYDYYPFGMLMPQRFVQDATIQCIPVTKTVYTPVYFTAIDVANVVGSIANGTIVPFVGTTITPVSLNNNDAALFSAAPQVTLQGNTHPEPAAATIGFTISDNTVATVANTAYECQLDIIGDESAVTLSLEQQDAQGNTVIIGKTTFINATAITLKATSISTNPISIKLSLNNMGSTNVTLSAYKLIRTDLVASNKLITICSSDADFNEDYRYGFNGQEKDNEIKGDGNSLDPLASKYPSLSPYCAMENNPINYVDMDGREPTKAAYARAAATLGVPIEVIRAVAITETQGSAFYPGMKPKVLFERHYFHRFTDGAYDGSNPGISNAKKGGWGLQSAQEGRLNEAVALDEEAAYKSASYGAFQLMGDKFTKCGYSSAKDFASAMMTGGEDEHLEAFVSYIKSDQRLMKALENKDWAKFAKFYNGSDY